MSDVCQIFRFYVKSSDLKIMIINLVKYYNFVIDRLKPGSHTNINPAHLIRIT